MHNPLHYSAIKPKAGWCVCVFCFFWGGGGQEVFQSSISLKSCKVSGGSRLQITDRVLVLVLDGETGVRCHVAISSCAKLALSESKLSHYWYQHKKVKSTNLILIILPFKKISLLSIKVLLC